MRTDEQLWAILPEALEARLGPGVAADAGGGPAVSGRPAHTMRGSVAVVPIEGTLVHRAQRFGDLPYSVAAAAVSLAMADPAATAVLLRINSPGGTVAGVEELVAAVRAAKKPIYAYTDAVMASAAYWVGSQARRIGAARTAQVGSVGVVAAHADYSVMMDKAGLKITYITSGRYKAMGNPAEPLGDDARQYFQERLDAVYHVFVGDVAGGRGLNTSTADAWADGKIFPAQAAADAGLVDRVEGFEAFLSSILGGDHQARTPASGASADSSPLERWRADAALRAEFGNDLGRYEAYMRAASAGRAHVVTGPTAITGRPV